MSEQKFDTLYARLGGYDAIAAVTDDLMPRLILAFVESTRAEIVEK